MHTPNLNFAIRIRYNDQIELRSKAGRRGAAELYPIKQSIYQAKGTQYLSGDNVRSGPDVCTVTWGCFVLASTSWPALFSLDSAYADQLTPIISLIIFYHFHQANMFINLFIALFLFNEQKIKWTKASCRRIPSNLRGKRNLFFARDKAVFIRKPTLPLSALWVRHHVRELFVRRSSL